MAIHPMSKNRKFCLNLRLKKKKKRKSKCIPLKADKRIQKMLLQAK